MVCKMCKCSGTTNQIVSQLASDEKLMAMLYKLKGGKEYTQDIIQDIFLQMIEKEAEDKLQRLCAKNEMKFFLIACVSNQINKASNMTNQTKLARTYRPIHTASYPVTIYEMLMTDKEDNLIDVIEFNKAVEEEIEKLHFYEKFIFKTVLASDKTFKELAKEINIKEYNIFYTYNKTKLKIRKKLKRKGF